MKTVIESKVMMGRLVSNRNALSDTFAQFEGKDVAITIEVAKKKRSGSQNRYYHGVVLPLIQNGLKDATGEHYSHEQVHDLLRHKYLVVDVPFKDGLFAERVKSSTELSTIEFEDYQANCKVFAAEFLGVVIPEPNEQLTFEN